METTCKLKTRWNYVDRSKDKKTSTSTEETSLEWLITYRGAGKSLARPTYRCIFLLIRIFLLMLVLLYI